MPRLYRLAYLVSHPIQYQAPLLRKIAALPEADLTVFFMSDLSVRGYQDPGFGTVVQWDVPLLSGYRHSFLPCLGPKSRLSFWRPLVYGLRKTLRPGEFDALWVHGYAHYATLIAVVLAKRYGMKVFLRGESNLLKEKELSVAKRWIKKELLRRLFNTVDAFLAIGTLNRQFYVHYGVPEDKMFWMPYAVDNDFFRGKAVEAKQDRESLRRELGLDPERPVILYASKLQTRKRPGDLLEAYIRLSLDGLREPWPYLLYVGDGEERGHLEGRARALGWKSVRFLGFRNQSELPRYYDLCDVFVLPSEYEPWGLVVNEAMNAGKPVVVSDRMGCAPDLVRDGENGFVYPAGDVQALTGRLKRLISDPALARRMGERSRQIIDRWDFEADVQGLLAAVRSTLGEAEMSSSGAALR